MIAPLGDKDIEALLLLLDAEDGPSRQHVEGRLRQVLAIEPERVSALLPKLDQESRRCAEDFLEDARWEALERGMKVLARTPDARFDLEQGVWLLASTAYPGLAPEAISKPLDEMAVELKARLADVQADGEVLARINTYLFTELGFKGNSGDYYDPDNSYMNRVLERRLGMPITLCCLYLFLGRRLGLPFLGIGLPGHFIAAYCPPGGKIYLDAFQKGRAVDEAECKQIVARQGIAFEAAHLKPVSHRAVLARMTANLVRIYEGRKDERRKAKLASFLKLLEQPRA